MSERMITICGACRKACCWQGIDVCEDYQVAGTEELPESRLREMALEHPDYWLTDEELAGDFNPPDEA